MQIDFKSFGCKCLNVTGSYSNDNSGQTLLESISIQFKLLVSRQGQTLVCRGCNTQVLYSDRPVFLPLLSHVVVDLGDVVDEAAMQQAKSSTKYSTIFKIILPESQASESVHTIDRGIESVGETFLRKLATDHQVQLESFRRSLMADYKLNADKVTHEKLRLYSVFPIPTQESPVPDTTTADELDQVFQFDGVQFKTSKFTAPLDVEPTLVESEHTEHSIYSMSVPISIPPTMIVPPAEDDAFEPPHLSIARTFTDSYLSGHSTGRPPHLTNPKTHMVE